MNNSSPLIIRSYREDDHAAVLSLHERALKETGALLTSGPWDEDLNDISTVYLKSGGAFLVGELDGEIVAMVALRPISSSKAEVKRLRVDPKYQRNGFGRIMLDHIETGARTHGYNQLILDTSSKQEAALHLFHKFGYQETRRGSHSGLEVIFLEKTLS